MVCLDETFKQLISETRVPIPAKPGHPARHDYEYARNDTAAADEVARLLALEPKDVRVSRSSGAISKRSSLIG